MYHIEISMLFFYENELSNVIVLQSLSRLHKEYDPIVSNPF